LERLFSAMSCSARSDTGFISKKILAYPTESNYCSSFQKIKAVLLPQCFQRFRPASLAEIRLPDEWRWPRRAAAFEGTIAITGLVQR
jgi:hypothetical protein